MSHLVICNQEVNYLTIGLANAFRSRFESVTLVTGYIHPQGETLDPSVNLVWINRMQERPSWRKAWSYLLALIRFWWLLMTRFRKHEVLFVSVPPMGYLLNLLLPHRFSMVIWDLYPETLKVSGITEQNWLFRFWGFLNRKSFRKAYRIFTIGNVLADAMSKYVDRKKLIVQPIWSMFREVPKIPPEENQFIRQHGLENKFIVQYSGNIGETHNVECLIDLAEKLGENPKILFQIIGRGPRCLHIEKLVNERALPNVTFYPFQPEDMFPHSLSAASLGVVVLDERVSRGSVPSKAYNLMSFGIPALYVSSPESQLALDAAQFGHAQCFTVNELDGIVDYILKLSENPEFYGVVSSQSRKAARAFQPENARRFVQVYLEAI
jgi:hypothetical protein